MPRADPTRSDYCASRHLLRNLDAAAELRRNPLVRDYFPFMQPAQRAPRRNLPGDHAALGRICDDVRAALAGLSEHAGDAMHVNLGRMHAVLLRCEIDDSPPFEVAAEIGLSERQLRRERRAAHEAFVQAFRGLDRALPATATVCDVATVRLAEAVELHELGHGFVAQSAFRSIAAAAPAGRRIEALCLAAEAEFDALRHAEAAAHLDAARTVMVRQARELDDDGARAADEHVDFVAWLLRWQTAASAGLGTQPPLVLMPCGDDRARSESRRALFVRAAAAYASQRWEVGDGKRGCGAVRRGLAVLPTLHPARTKEQLALMTADAQMYGFHAARGEDRMHFARIEELAAAHGHVHVMLAARADRIAGEAASGPGECGPIFDGIIRAFHAADRRTMARAFTTSAIAVSQCESNPEDALASAHLVEKLVPSRSAAGLMARCQRAYAAAAAHRYAEAREHAQAVYSDAEFVGNARIRGGAARALASAALGCRRRGEAQRYIREALSLIERHGSPEALARANALARRLDVA
ncbi:MAG TPA: hypothetical protein VGC72_11685 [Candidatus Elarobacter sp.]|jgi:hypothetical protein